MEPKGRRTKLWIRNYLVVTVLLAATLPVMAQIQEPEISATSNNEIVALGRPDGEPITIISPAADTTIERIPVKVVIKLGNGVNPYTFQAWLNGQKITGKFFIDPDCGSKVCEISATVTLNDSLAKGGNEVNAEVQTNDFRQASDSVEFTVASASPKADTGQHQRYKTGQTVRLDGTRSTASDPQNPGNLTHHWRLLSIPPESKAVLSNSSTPTPTFVADKAGTYVAELVVSEDGQFDSDPATVALTASSSIALVPVVTIAKRGGDDFGIQVGDQYYSGSGSMNGTGVQILVLDRATLNKVDFQAYPGGSDPAGKINAYLNSLDDSKLVIVSSAPGGTGFALSGIASSLAQFGANQAVSTINNSIVFSFIGVKGMNSGQAHQVGNGWHQGYFVNDSQGNYTFAQFDYVKYEIIPYKVGGTPAVIKLTFPDGTVETISSDQNDPRPAQGGFMVVVKDRAQLTTVEGPTIYYTLADSEQESITQQNNMQQALEKYATNPAVLIFVVSVRSAHNYNTSGKAEDYAALAKTVLAIGGTYNVFNQLTTSDTYSLIVSPGTQANPKLTDPGTYAESSSLRSPKLPDGILRGVLGRGNIGNWYEVVSSSLIQSTDLDLYTFIAQPSQPWPVPGNDPRQQQAYSYISKQLCDCSDLRQGYPNFNISIVSWQAYLATLQNPNPGNDPSKPFGDTEFDAVKQQIISELRWVANVQNFQKNLASLWTDQQANFSLLSASVSQRVKDAVAPQPDHSFLHYFELFLEQMVSVAEQAAAALLFAPAEGERAADILVGGAEGFVVEDNDGPDLSIPVAVVQAITSIVFQWVNDKFGGPADDTKIIDDTVANLDERAAFTFAQQLAGLGTLFDIILEDWGKLSSVGQKLNNPENRQWYWNGSQTTGQLLNTMSISLEQSIYRGLMPTVFNLREFDSDVYEDVSSFSDDGNTTGEHWNDWPQQASIVDRNEQMRYTGSQGWNAVWLDKGKGDLNKSAAAQMLDHLFNPVSAGGLGLFKADLFRHWPFHRTCYIDKNAANVCNNQLPNQP